MNLNLDHIGQIALAVGDVDRAEAFYRDVLGLRKLYRFGDLTFFDCAGVRLMLEKAEAPENIAKSSVIYFRCADIALAVRELEKRGRSGSSCSTSRSSRRRCARCSHNPACIGWRRRNDESQP